MSIKGRPTGAPAPLIKNSSAAPFVYFDNAPVYGAFGGNVEVELTARALMPKQEGSIISEVICVGHLRCTPQAALALAEALSKAVDMHSRQLVAQAASAKTATSAPDEEGEPAA